jgi:hypothetical protein
MATIAGKSGFQSSSMPSSFRRAFASLAPLYGVPLLTPPVFNYISPLCARYTFGVCPLKLSMSLSSELSFELQLELTGIGRSSKFSICLRAICLTSLLSIHLPSSETRQPSSTSSAQSLCGTVSFAGAGGQTFVLFFFFLLLKDGPYPESPVLDCSCCFRGSSSTLNLSSAILPRYNML